MRPEKDQVWKKLQDAMGVDKIDVQIIVQNLSLWRRAAHHVLTLTQGGLKVVTAHLKNTHSATYLFI
jgi:hypothetical protein